MLALVRWLTLAERSALTRYASTAVPEEGSQ